MKVNRLHFVKLLMVACIFACGRGSVSGQNLTPDQLINPFFTKFNLAGLSCALVKGDSLVFSKGYGKANIRTNTDATANTVFIVASVSKAVTGVAMMKLVQQGSISLDADVSIYLPFELKNPFHPTKKITCRQLLSHTSSIVDTRYDLLPDTVLYSYGVDHPLPLATFCQRMFKPAGQWYSTTTWANEEPGKSYDYSNLGSALAGYIVERVANQPFDLYCTAQIFTPLGMDSTNWLLSQIPAADRAMPYNTNNVAYGHYTFADYPNGGLRTSVENMSRFLRMFALGGTLQGTQILSQATVTTMKTKHFPNVSEAEEQRLAFYDLQTARYNLMGHSGAEQGCLCEMWYNPATNAGVIIFINKDASNEDLYESDVDILVDKLIGVAETLQTPWQSWQAAHFTVAECANPAISGPAADPEGDGLTNLIEYGTGTLPRNFTASPLLTSPAGGLLTVRYTKNLHAPDVTLIPEQSTTLATGSWTPVTATPTVISTVNQIQTLEVTIPTTGASTKFARLRATQ